MATLKLLHEDETLGRDIEVPSPTDRVSFAEYYRGVEDNHGTMLRFSFGDAYGTCKIVPNGSNMYGFTYYMEIRGRWIDVQVIRARFEAEIGVRDLTPKFSALPDLKNAKERILWLLSWIRSGKE